MVQEQLGMPVYVDNDVRAMALGEKWYGSGQHLDNFIFVNTGAGIGAGIILNGKLYYGRDWTAGEFGHMTVVEDGPRCSCGNHGCLESIISLNRMVSLYDGKNSGNSCHSYKEIKSRWLELVQSAETGEEKACGILKTTGKFLGTGIANLANLF